MTDADKPPFEKPAAPNTGHADFLKSRRRMPLLAIILPPLIILGFFYAFDVMHLRMMTGTTVAPSAAPVMLELEQRVTADETKIQTLEARLSDMDSRLAAVSNAPAAATPADTHAQNDLAALTAEVTALQTEMKQAGVVAGQTIQAAQTALTAGMAYMRLRSDIDAGRGFAGDLPALRAAAGSDTVLQTALSQLEPYADKGVTRLDALRAEFERLEGPASNAVDKATAQSWRDKLLAELKGLVSIRPLHGAPVPDSLAAAETALDAGDIPAALEAVKALPTEAQDVFKDWQAEAEARVAADKALQIIAEHLVMPARTEP